MTFVNAVGTALRLDWPRVSEGPAGPGRSPQQTGKGTPRMPPHKVGKAKFWFLDCSFNHFSGTRNWFWDWALITANMTDKEKVWDGDVRGRSPKSMNSVSFCQISYFEILWAVGETKSDNSLTEQSHEGLNLMNVITQKKIPESKSSIIISSSFLQWILLDSVCENVVTYSFRPSTQLPWYHHLCEKS